MMPKSATGDGRQFATFIITGGIAAAVNLATRWGFSLIVRFEIAVALSYVIALTTGFILARRFVFAGSGAWLPEYLRFALVNVMSFFIVMGVSIGLARYGFPAIGLRWHAEDLAHLIGVISPIATSYYAHKHFSFGKG